MNMDARSLSDNSLVVECFELLLRNGLVHLHVLKSPHRNVPPWVEISRTLRVDTALGLLDLVLSELN
jgi:hypothetical protein